VTQFRDVPFDEHENFPKPTRETIAPLLSTLVIRGNGVEADLKTFAHVILFCVKLTGRFETGFVERVAAIVFRDVDGIRPFRPPPGRLLETLVVSRVTNVVAPKDHAAQHGTPIGPLDDLLESTELCNRYGFVLHDC
jgi:hypothetical protein